MSTTYTIKLPQFEGPFDLLLFFIERDELDIHDIPIAKVTDDFLEYTRQLEELDIDLASEFVLVAATLCRIKAKMLIPRKPIDDEGNEIDPREELVQRLLEYKRYKSIIKEMRDLEAQRAMRNTRGNVSGELQQIATKALVDAELESVTLFKLLRTFERLMQRIEDSRKQETIHRILQFNYTTEDQQQRILALVENNQRPTFTDIFSPCQDRIHAIVTFLSLLDLLNIQQIRLIGGSEVNNFWIEIIQITEEE